MLRPEKLAASSSRVRSRGLDSISRHLFRSVTTGRHRAPIRLPAADARNWCIPSGGGSDFRSNGMPQRSFNSDVLVYRSSKRFIAIKKSRGCRVQIQSSAACETACCISRSGTVARRPRRERRSGSGDRGRDGARATGGDHRHRAETHRRHQGHSLQRLGHQRRHPARAPHRRLRRPYARAAGAFLPSRGGAGARHHRDPRREFAVGIGHGRHLRRRGLGDGGQQPVRRRRAAEGVRSRPRRSAARSAGDPLRREFDGRYDKIHHQTAGPQCLRGSGGHRPLRDPPWRIQQRRVRDPEHSGHRRGVRAQDWRRPRGRERLHRPLRTDAHRRGARRHRACARHQRQHRHPRRTRRQRHPHPGVSCGRQVRCAGRLDAHAGIHVAAHRGLRHQHLLSEHRSV